jgi:hypothetical protein
MNDPIAFISKRVNSFNETIYVVGVRNEVRRVECFLKNHWRTKATAEKHRRILQYDLDCGFIEF